MTNPDAIFDAVAAPVYAGLAIVLLLSAREVENFRCRRDHRANKAVRPALGRRNPAV